MSTERQKRANAANAAKSTGPRTSEGRARSAGNARKHGLNSAPAWDQVRPYLFLITGADEVDPMDQDAVSRAALALAEAEAQVARCVMAERRHLAQMAETAGQNPFAPIEDAAAEKQEENDVSGAYMEWLGAKKWTSSTDPKPKTGKLPDLDQPAAMHRMLKTLMRYRKEAESQRRKALRRWLEVQPVGETRDEEALRYL